MQSFLSDFEITGKEGDYVRSSTIEEWIQRKRLGISMKKFGTEITKYSVVNSIEGVFSKDKKLSGKNVKVWSGLREIVEIQEVAADMEL